MRTVGRLYLILLISATPLLALEPGDNAVQPPVSLLSQGILNTGVETAGSVTDGQFSIMQPLWSSLGDTGVLAGSLVYAEPYATWIERGAVQAGLGLGVRHLFGSQPTSALSEGSSHVAGFLEEGWYVGANLYADMLETSNDVRYWQMAPGLEIGTRYLELRAHYYLPLTDGETTHTSRTTVLQSSSDLTTGGIRFIDHRVTTIRTKADVLHESLQGWDVETAALVPWLDQYMDLKLVGGYASFHSTSLDAIKYDSWKAGVELRPLPACVLSATWYANQRLVGDHWMYGIRLELPFETADIGDGLGGFWGHIKAAFHPRRRHLAERMVESAHAHQLEAQIAIYPTKITTRATSQFRGTIILPDGQVIQVHSEQAFSSQHTQTGGTSTTTSSASISGATFNLVDWAAVAVQASSPVSAAVDVSMFYGLEFSSISFQTSPIQTAPPPSTTPPPATTP